MLLLISDANILIDIEVAELVKPMFSLSYTFAVPDVIYYEELEERHQHFLCFGLKIHTLQPKSVERVQILSQRYPKPSRNDLFALALAEVEQCPLLTGDAALRNAAVSEKVEIKGTIWLVSQMIVEDQITPKVARAAIEKMRKNGRRLPWSAFDEMLCELENP